MNLPGTVIINVTAGNEPGQLMGQLVFKGEDGSVYDEQEPVLLTPGNSLSYGPCWVSVTLGSQFKHEATNAPPTLPAKPATPPGKPTPPTPAGRR
jgi:hypothetical protein